MPARRTIRVLTFAVGTYLALAAFAANAQTASAPGAAALAPSTSSLLPSGLGGPQQWTSPEGLSSTLQVMILLTVVSLAPALLLMTTSFIRILVVLGLLRQAIGAQQLPPSQVITSIALFMTVLLMTPVWTAVYDESIKPYTAKEIDLETAWDRGTMPLRRFMADQIRITENTDEVYLFLKYMPSEADPETGELPDYVFYTGDDTDGPVNGNERLVPLQALLPAFMLSELKTAFLIGFQVYLPFVILDIVVASVTISMGMLMLPPVLISLPFKLLLFVLVDGWKLVIGMLMESFHVI